MTQPVNQRIGVIGGGQLAWMMAGAAKSLQLDLNIQTPSETDPAAPLAKQLILAPVADAAATAQLAQYSDVITFENEFVDLEALQQLAAQGVCFAPSLNAIKPLLDKYDQRSYLQKIGLPVPDFRRLTSDYQPTIFPVVLKVRRHGYDGQGTMIIADASAFQSVKEELGETPAMVEDYVPFERELAVIVARNGKGETALYPLIETHQENQVCRWTMTPATSSETITDKAQEIAQALMSSLDYVGIMGIELFQTTDEQLLINEIAPRTHNSGHFTLDACAMSQFEAHLRAVAGLSFGSAELSCAGAVMVNLLGSEDAISDYREKRECLQSISQASVHWYNKSESRVGRKLGHVTALSQKVDTVARTQELLSIIDKVESIWYR